MQSSISDCDAVMILTRDCDLVERGARILQTRNKQCSGFIYIWYLCLSGIDYMLRRILDTSLRHCTDYQFRLNIIILNIPLFGQ